MIKVEVMEQYLKNKNLKAKIVKADKLLYRLKELLKIKNLSNKIIPDYLFESDKAKYLFFKYNYEVFSTLNDTDKEQYFKDILFYYEKLSTINCDTIIFVIVDSALAAETVSEYKRNYNNTHFLKILVVNNEGILNDELTNRYNLSGRLLESVLTELKKGGNLKGKIAEIIKKFANKYLSIYKEGNGDQLEIIREFIDELLNANSKCYLKSKHIDFMADIERALSKMGAETIRDHYYHACNTLLIGFLIIDKFYSKFSDVLERKIGKCDIELIWTIISLFHDVGYPMEKLPDIICEAAGLDKKHQEKIVKYLVKFRRDCWENIELYKDATLSLDNMYFYLVKNNGKFHLFKKAKKILSPEFHEGLKKAFISNGYHGVVSAINLALTFEKIKKAHKDKQSLNILFTCVIYSSVSMLWHDWKTRAAFRNIAEINANDFPLAYLLTYIDILQEDRREFGDITKADFFEGIESDDSGAIVATLNKNALQLNRKKRDDLYDQLSKALSFYVTEDLRFGIPAALSYESLVIDKDGVRNLESLETVEV